MKTLLVLLALAGISLAQVCEDKNWYCPMYARFGYCKAEPEQMKRICPKSCNMCGSGGNPKPDGSGQKPDQCGIAKVEPRIVSGEVAKKDAWPWQISLYYNGQFMCGGSILSPRWVLTAAHCVDGFDYRGYQIVLGDYNRKTVDGDEQVYRAVRAFHHPDWMRPSELNNDMALIELDKPAVFNDHVQPICLPDADSEIPAGTQCYITGWGQHDIGQSGPPALVLKQALLTTVSQNTCYNMNTRNLGIRVTNHMICAGKGPNDPTSGCHGDSGGPFVCRENSGRWVLRGSVSWGSGYCRSSEAYTVFAKISSQVKWIESYVY